MIWKEACHPWYMHHHALWYPMNRWRHLCVLCSIHTHTKKRSLNFQFPFSSNLKIQISFLGCRSSSIKRSEEFIKQYQSYASICSKPMFIPGNNILNSIMESMIFIFSQTEKRKFSLVYTPSCCKISYESIKPSQNSELRCTKSLLTPKVWKTGIKSLNFSFFKIWKDDYHS